MVRFGPGFWLVGVGAFVGIVASAPERAWAGGGVPLVLAVMVLAGIGAVRHNRQADRYNARHR